MPAGAEIVHFDMQDDRPCIWAKVNPYEATLQREFYILGAGYDIHDSLEYVGAIQQGIYVWHLFEKKL